MHIQSEVPSIVGEMWVNNVTNAILKTDPHAVVRANLEAKPVGVETKASEADVKATIATIGYTVS
jgi:copper chaperone CopZ